LTAVSFSPKGDVKADADRTDAGDPRGVARSVPVFDENPRTTLGGTDLATPAPESLVQTLAAHGQEHVLRFWDRLDDEGRQRLADQIRSLDLALLDRLAAEHLSDEEAATAAPRLEPAEVIPLPVSPDEVGATDAARAAGEGLLRAGKVAVLTVAGGQGSRLGFDGPKGAFPIGPVTGMTLFEHFARTVRALRRRFGASLPWLIMTSETNHVETTEFFAANQWFGLKPDTVHFFTQGMIPSVSREGKMLLAAPDRVAVNPNGHGGTLLALKDSGMLDRLRDAGVEIVHYFQVDNPLVNIADPVFLGHHRLRDAEMSSKAVEKTGPDEKVGVFARINGKLGVIEYSDLDEDLARERRPDGALRFGAGSIAIHVFNVRFIERVTTGRFSLPFHKAVKKVAHLDEAGHLVEPSAPNAIKFETFVFDALAFAERAVTLMTRREDEFSPVKNATGVDSAVTARQHLVDRAWRWLAEAGVEPLDAVGRTPPVIEIDPLLALDAGELKERLPAGFCPGSGLFLTETDRP